MYNVSSEYKAQLHKSVFKFDLEGRLTNTGNFYADNILAGSLSITNQCASGNKIIMGSVYIGELRATFVDTADIAVGDTITLSESMYVDDLNSYESVPLGAYKVVQSTKSRSGIEVIAYDYMSKFDKPAELAEVDGTVFEWLRYCCSMCNVTMAQTQAQVEALPNGTVQFRCYLADGFKCTYRDVISWLAQIIGGFATMDRQGRVKLVTYEQLTTVNTIYAGDRYNDYSFGLNTTLWDAIKYTYIAGGGEEERVIGTSTSEETTFDFGANPFLQADDVATNHALTRLLDVVENMVFVPFKVRVASGACYDLGDTVRMHGGSAPNPFTSVYCITNLEWHYNGGTVLGGAGGNTAIGSGGSSGGSSGGGGGTGGGGGHTYNDFEGATSSADGTHGLVPAPLIADKDKFLCGDGTWKEVQGGGGGGGLPDYSTTEHKTGRKWIDGSDIWEKTLVLRENGVNNYTYSGNVFQNALPTNLRWINITSSFLTRQNDGYVDVMNSTAITIVPNIQTGGMFVSTGGTVVPTIIITVEYTKV